MPNNDLMWYRHDSIVDGTFRWAASNGKKSAPDGRSSRSFQVLEG